MGIDTTSRAWSAFSVSSANASLGLGGRATVYAFRNADNGERFLFLLADLGFGFSAGVRLNQAVRVFSKALLSDKAFNNPKSYTSITCNRAFSADDLDWSPGAEATAGIAVFVAGASATSISAWPFFQGAPQAGEVNNDYFTGQVIYSTNDVGLSASAAYQFIGRWIHLYTF